MAHNVAGWYSGTLVNTGNPSSITIPNVNVGTGAGRAIQITFTRRIDRFTAVNSATIGGEAMTVQGSDQSIPGDTTRGVRGLCRINPTVEGTQDLVITCASADSGNSSVEVMVEVIDGIDTAQSAPTPTVNTGTSDTATVTETSATGNQVVVAMTVSNATNADTIAPTGWTVPAENNNPTFGGNLGWATGYAAGAASVVADGAWLDGATPRSGGWVAQAYDYTPAASGPTIDTQPVADVVLINGDPSRASASYTVAATTSGGALTYDWQIESGVGTGSYATVSSGSGATWSGVTTTNLTGTFTDKTLTGRRVRCAVTDSNGTTNTDAVLLTVYTGPVISKSSGTTNGSGVDTLTIVSDYPNADGEFTTVTATAGGVTKQVALHYEAP